MKRLFLIAFSYPFIIGILLTMGVIGLAHSWPAALCYLLLAAAAALFVRLVFLYRRSIDRLQRERRLIEQVQGGNFSVRFPAETERVPLMGELGAALNFLLESLRTTIDEANEERLLQAAVLSGLNEGIVLTDAHGKVKFETPLSQRFLEGEKTSDDKKTAKTGRAADDYLSLRGLNASHVWQQIHRSIGENKALTEVLEFAGGQGLRYVEVYTAPLGRPEGEGGMAVLRDVTHMKQLESLRRDFVANVTHELKTPLTSIRGYIELLRAKKRSPAEAEQFYDILDIEADRLQNLISDLLDLSEIEGGDRTRLRDETVSLYEIGDEVFSELELLAQKQDVRLKLDADPDFCFKANHFRVKQMLVNLVSNAIKYNKPGGDVRLTGRRERCRIIIEVRDSGIGIAKEHLPRLFERFYRVSKSRSRDLGGTGLGLAIVKHIAGLYGGSVHVASRVGEGTVFTVILPDIS